MNEQRAASRPTESGPFVFPDEVLDPELRHQQASVSSRGRSAADLRAGSVQPQASGTKAVSNLNKTSAALEINALKERVTTLEEENETLRSSVSKIKSDARKEKTRVEEQLIEIRQLIETVQQDSGGKMEVDSGSEDNDKKAMTLDADVTEKLEKSNAASNSNIFLALLRQVFSEAMGCPSKLTGETLPAYPNEEAAWPMILRAGVEVKAIRFHWDQTYSHEINWKNLQFIMTEIRKNGPQYSPAAASAITDISDEDLQHRVIWKFNELVKTIKSWKKLQQASAAPVVVVISSSPEVEGGQTASDGGTVSTAVVVHELSVGARNSRAKGKLDVRIRKRGNLDKKHELRDKKYDPAMTHTLMSDDEDTIKDGEIIKTEFTSRPPAYRSVELKDFYTALDKLPDPMPAQKYIKRTAGAAKDVPPPIAKKLENRARRWMISPEWLGTSENKKFDVPMRISASGVAWGDDKDPEEIEATLQRVKEEKADIKRQKTKNEGEKEKAKAKAKKGKGKEKARAVSRQPVASSSRAQNTCSPDRMYESD